MKLRSKRLKSPEKTNEDENEAQPNPVQQAAVQPVAQNDTTEKLLKQLFENVNSKVAFTRALKTFVERNEIYSKFKPIRRRFSRRKTVVYGPFNTYQIDLSDYRSARRQNNNYGWILFIIDAFSRYGYCIPMKYKAAKYSRPALEKWFLSLNHLPKFIYSDKGKEFIASSVQQLFRDRGVTHFLLAGPHKASIVERFQRTIKSSLEMYFYKTKKRRWIDVIDKIVYNYNHRYHRTIQMAPAEITYENFEEVYKRLYPKNTTQKLCKLKVGDVVRIAVEKKQFSKGYSQNFSDELYKITKVINYRSVCQYTVQLLTGGRKYKKYYHELSLVLSNVDTPGRKEIRHRRAVST